MANNQYNQIMGNNPMPQQNQPVNWQDAMRQLCANPIPLIRQGGYNVPDEIGNNPQAAAMYIIQSGQVKAPVMR